MKTIYNKEITKYIENKVTIRKATQSNKELFPKIILTINELIVAYKESIVSVTKDGKYNLSNKAVIGILLKKDLTATANDKLFGRTTITKDNFKEIAKEFKVIATIKALGLSIDIKQFTLSQLSASNKMVTSGYITKAQLNKYSTIELQDKIKQYNISVAMEKFSSKAKEQGFTKTLSQ